VNDIVESVQERLPLHVRPVQHGSPISPHVAQVAVAPKPEQTRLPVQVSAVAPVAPPAPLLAGSQQGWPTPPQSLVHDETPPSPGLEQPSEGPQAAVPKPLQQASPASPHFMHWLCPEPPAFWTQPRSLSHGVADWQQG